MDKKLLIGVSIFVVVLFALGSLSNVVGYQSVKSTVNDSPLFQTRTKRAINDNGNDIVLSQYLGKGKNTLLILNRDSRTEFIRKIIDKISQMDDATFTEFINKIISRLSHQKEFKNININKIITGFRYLRNNPQWVKRYVNNANENHFLANQKISIYQGLEPGCIIENIRDIIEFIIFLLFLPVIIVLDILLLLGAYFSIGICQTSIATCERK